MEGAIVFGVIFLIAGIFFWFPQLGMLFHAWSFDESDAQFKKTYRPLAKTLMLLGLVLLALGLILFLYASKE